MMLITLAQGKDQVREDGTANDFSITECIEDASAAVINYLAEYADTFINTANMDSAGNPIEVPREVQRATRLMVGYLFANRDNDKDHEYEMGFLPRPVTALLYPLRTPTVA